MRRAIVALAKAIGWLAALVGGAAWAAALDVRLDGLTGLAPVGLATAGLALITVAWLERRLAIGALAGLLACGVMVAPDAARTLARTWPKEPPSLTLVQFNTFERNEEWTERRLTWLARLDPDVIVLQEVASEDRPLLARLSAAYPHQATCESAPHPCPVMVLSKDRPIAAGHFSSGMAPQPNVAWVRLAPGFTIAGVHVDRPRPDGRQEAQLRRLAAQVRTLEPATLVLAGDFNAVPWAFAMRRFERGSGLVRRTALLPTWPSPPALPIDHVFAGRAWKTVRVERGPFLGSDHRPVVITLSRP